MTNTELVAKIKRILEDPEGVEHSELAELARLFAARCRQTDEGFGRANAALQAGALCETDRLLGDEKLHEDYMTLMFDQFDDWQNVCRVLELEVPAGISRDAGANLFVFELEYESAREYFEKYRFQELARAPVAERLATLHTIKGMMSAYSEVFRKPLERLEREFDAVVAKEIPTIPVNPQGLARLNALYAELVSDARETRADDAVVNAALAKIEYMNNVASLARLQGLVERWRYASSEDEIRQYYRSYQSEDFRGAVSVAPPAVAQELKALIDMALQVERDFAAREKLRVKMNQLESALDRSNDADEIANLFHEVEFAAAAAGKSTPQSVEERKRKKVDSILTQARRKRSLIIGVVCFILALFAFLTYMAIIKSQLRSDASELAAQISSALDAYETKNQYDQLAVAGGLVDGSNPRFMDVPEFASVAERYRVAQSAEDKRAEDFKTTLAEINDEHENGRSATGKIAKLKKLVRTNEEQIQYNDSYKVDLNLSQASQAATTEKYRSKLDAIAADVKKLESITELADRRREIARLKTELKNLADDEKSAAVPAALISDRKSLDATVAAYDKTIKQNAVFQETLGELTRGIGSKDRYAAALASLAQKLDDAPKSSPDAIDSVQTAIQNAQRDLQTIENVDAWNQFVAAYPTVGAVVASPTSYAAAAPKLTRFSFSEESAEVVAKIDRFKNFAEKGGFSGAEEKLSKSFKKYSRPLWSYFARDDYYYVTSDPSRKSSSLKYQTSIDATPKDFNADEAGDGSTASAIQYNVSKAISSNLDNTPKGWKSAVDAALDALNERDVKKADPAFRLALIVELADACGSFPGYEPLAKFANDARANPEIDLTINFYEPSKELGRARVASVAALRSLTDLEKIKTQATLAFNELEAPCGQKYDWVGFLDVENEGVVIRRQTLPQESGSFWIAPGANATIIKCADYKDGEIIWASTKDWQEYRWTPVYFRKDAPSKP